MDKSRKEVTDIRLRPPNNIKEKITTWPNGLQYEDVLTTARPVIVIADVAVKRATSKLVIVPSLLETGRANSVPPINARNVKEAKKMT